MPSSCAYQIISDAVLKKVSLLSVHAKKKSQNLLPLSDAMHKLMLMKASAAMQ